MLLGAPPFLLPARPGALLPPATPRRAALGFVCLGWPRRGAGVGRSSRKLWSRPSNLSLAEEAPQSRCEQGPGAAASLLELCGSFLWYISPLRLGRRPHSLLTLRKGWCLILGVSALFRRMLWRGGKGKGTWAPHSRPGTREGTVDHAREHISQTALKWKEGADWACREPCGR